MEHESEHEDVAEPERDPVEVEIDDLLAEHAGDSRAVIRALLHDVDSLARDVENISWGYVRARPSRQRQAG